MNLFVETNSFYKIHSEFKASHWNVSVLISHEFWHKTKRDSNKSANILQL